MKTIATNSAPLTHTLAALVFLAAASHLGAQITVGGNGTNTTDTNNYSGAQSLTKTGSNTVTLSGTNTYTGTTTVSGGNLTISGSSTGSSTTTVGAAGGAVLDIAGGTFTATSGVNTYDTTIGAGTTSGQSGALRMSSGSLTASKGLTVGNNGGYGYYGQSGGSATVGGFLALGLVTNTSSVVDLSGGSFAMTTAPVTIGATAGNTTSSLNISGTAAFRHNSTGANGIWVGEGGTGSLNMAGSSTLTVVSGNTDGIILGKLAGSAGSLNLAGGTVIAPKISKGSGSGTLFFNGGTLQANVSTNAFLSGLTAAYVAGGGGTINNGGFTITVGQNLVAATGQGVSSIAMSNGGSGYIGAPNVKITGGSGSGAAGYAQFDAATGTVTGIVITSPGTGYATNDVLTVTLTGGGGTGASIGAVSLAANAPGGLRFSGAGTTYLTGNNTYSGGTLISAGTLGVGNGGTTGTFGTGAVTNNSAIVFDQYTTAYTISNTISGSGSVTKRGGNAITLTASNTFAGDYTQRGGTTILNRVGGPALYADGGPGNLIITNELGGIYAYCAVEMGQVNQLGTNVNVSFRPANITSGYSYLTLKGNDTTVGNISSTTAYASSWGIIENQETGSFGNSRITVTQTTNGTFTGEFRNGYGASVGTLGLTKNGAATLTLTSAGGDGINYSGTTIVNEGTLKLANATGFRSATTLGAGALLEVAPTGAQTITSTISGAGSLVKSAVGTLTLSSPNSFSGSVLVDGGTLYAAGANGASNAVFSYISGITINNGATLRSSTNSLFGWDGTQDKPITVNSGGTLLADNGVDVGVSVVTLAGGTLANSGNNTNWGTWRFDNPGDKLLITENSSVTAANVKFANGAYIDVSAGKVLAYSGAVTDLNPTNGGKVSLIKTGAGTMTLTGVNTYTGGTLISAGTLGVGNGGTTGTFGTGAVTNNGAIIFDQYTTAYTISNTISGSGSVTKRGGNAITLIASNTFAGDYTQRGGTTILNRTGGPALYADGGPGNLILGNELGGASYWYSAVEMGAANQLGTNVNLSFQPQNIASGLAFLTLKGNDTTIGNLSSTAAYASAYGIIENQETGSFGNSRLTVNQTTNGTFTGEFRNGYGTSVGTLGLTKNGAATLTLTSAGGAGISYSGTTIINEGTLKLANATGFASATTIGAGSILEVAPTGAQTIGSAISGAGSLVKSAAGTLTLSGTYTYTGDTYVTGGTLALTAAGPGGGSSALASTNFRVSSGATVSLGTAVPLGYNNDKVFYLDGGKVDIANGGYAYVKNLVMDNGAEFALGTGISTYNPNAANYALTSVTSSSNSTSASTITTRGGVMYGSTTYDIARGNHSGTADLTSSAVTADSGATPNTLTKNGSGVLVLTANNTYTGGTTVNGGTLRLSGTSASQSYAIGSGAVLEINYATTNTPRTFDGGTYTGSGTLRKTGAGLFAWTGNTAINLGSAATVDVQGGTLQASVSANQIWTSNQATLNVAAGATFDVDAAAARFGGLTGSGTVKLGLAGTNYTAQKLTIGVADASSTFGGRIINGTGVAPLEKIGSGTITLTGSNTYTGTTTISGGALQIGNGGTTGTLGTGNVTNNASLVFNRNNALAVSNAISGTGSVTQDGAGVTTLSASNSYTGGTTINAGKLATSGNDRLSDAGAVTVNGSGTFAIGGSETIGSLSGSGAVELGARLTTGASNSTYSGAASGFGGITKAGAGTFTLAGANTYQGDTVVAGGTLVLDNAHALWSGGVLSMTGSTTVTVNQRTFIGALDQGSGTVNGPGELVATLTLTESGALNAVLADGPDFAAGILKRTAGTTTIGGANTFTGAVNVQGGTLQLAAGGSFDAAASLALSAGATMDLNNKAQTFSAVNGAGGTVALGSGTLTVSGNGNSDFAGAITGTGSLTKSGLGTMTLSGTNTYTGATTVSGGRLTVNGSIAANSAVTVRASASLGGSGNVGAISGAGSVDPGNSPGILAATSLDPSGGLSFNFEFTGLAPLYGSATASGNDVLRLMGSTPFSQALTASNAVNIYFNVSLFEEGQTYTGGIFTDLQGDFLNQIVAADYNYYVKDAAGSVVYNGETYSAMLGTMGVELSTVAQMADFSGGSVAGQVIQFGVVPEPSTYALLSFAGLGAIVARLRWRRRG